MLQICQQSRLNFDEMIEQDGFIKQIINDLNIYSDRAHFIQVINNTYLLNIRDDKRLERAITIDDFLSSLIKTKEFNTFFLSKDILKMFKHFTKYNM